MNSRRKFISNIFAAGSITLVPFNSSASSRHSLSELKSNLDNQQTEDDFWNTIRMQFPLKLGQTYFNNGTMGPQPSFVIDKVIEDMRYNSIHAAETDYKGEGPSLLSGYFEYRELREKLASILNVNYKTIALTQNATLGMNFVANGLDFKANQEVINTDQEHGGGFAAW